MGGSQVSGTRVFCPSAVVGERHFSMGTGPFWAPKPPWHGPLGGHVGACVPSALRGLPSWLVALLAEGILPALAHTCSGLPIMTAAWVPCALMARPTLVGAVLTLWLCGPVAELTSVRD